jgi:arsenate reductase
MKLYGIPNCDTVKKARAWLSTRNIAVDFHDFRKQGVTAAWLQAVTQQTGWEALVNTRGTTWRQLDEAEKNRVSTHKSAIELMLAKSSVIKRPVLELNGRYHLGFSAEQYQAIFGESPCA